MLHKLEIVPTLLLPTVPFVPDPSFDIGLSLPVAMPLPLRLVQDERVAREPAVLLLETKYPYPNLVVS